MAVPQYYIMLYSFISSESLLACQTMEIKLSKPHISTSADPYYILSKSKYLSGTPLGLTGMVLEFLETFEI